MTPARRRAINRLKRRAAQHRRAASVHDDLDCGTALGDAIRGTDAAGAQLAYENCVRRLARVDPHFPEGAL